VDLYLTLPDMQPMLAQEKLVTKSSAFQQYLKKAQLSACCVQCFETFQWIDCLLQMELFECRSSSKKRRCSFLDIAVL
jgi:hypothetical protein